MHQALILPLTALALGAMHSFAPDHLAAVSVFVSRRPSWRQALGLGARWGLGHSLSILLVGGALVLLDLHLPERFAPVVERLVGVTLIVLGIAALWRARRLHAHSHAHDSHAHWHVHSHREEPGHDHDHGALLGIGMLHGLAGSGALVVALPVVVGASRGGSVLYLVVFGIGTIVSMALFGACAGWAISTTARLSARVLRVAVALAGLASTGVGLWWVIAGGA